jgi:hypothetical protein
MNYRTYLIKQAFMASLIGGTTALLSEKEQDEEKSKLKLVLKGATYGSGGALIGILLGSLLGGLGGGLGGAGWGALRKLRGITGGSKLKVKTPQTVKTYLGYLPESVSNKVPSTLVNLKTPNEPWASAAKGTVLGIGAGALGGGAIGSVLGGRSAAAEEDALSIARRHKLLKPQEPLFSAVKELPSALQIPFN